MAKGDHIRVRRLNGIYSHHGIDIGDGTVVHFSGEPFRFHKAQVVRDTLEAFLEGGRCKTVTYACECHDPEAVVARALDMVGATGYGLWSNNCEHFATYCKTGIKESSQVRRALRVGTSLAVTMTLAVATVAITTMARPGRNHRAA